MIKKFIRRYHLPIVVMNMIAQLILICVMPNLLDWRDMIFFGAFVAFTFMINITLILLNIYYSLQTIIINKKSNTDTIAYIEEPKHFQLVRKDTDRDEEIPEVFDNTNLIE